jgi:hypothetical protein
MLKILQAWYAQHKWLCRIIIGGVVLYTLTGFAVAPLVVRHILENQVSGALHRDVRSAAVRTNPFTFSLRLADLVISDKNGDAAFVRIDRLYINTDPLTSLFKWGVVIRSLRIGTPRVRIIRTGDNRFNFSDLLAPSPGTSPEKAGPESKPVRLVMGELIIASGEIQFADSALDMPFTTTVKALSVTVNELDTRPEADAFHYTLRGSTEADEQFEVRGSCDIHPVAVEALTTVENLAPAKYAPYYQKHLNAKLAQGRIDMHAELQWDVQTRAVSGLQMSVDDLVLQAAEAPKTLVGLPRLLVEDAGIDFQNRQIRLGRIKSQNARIFVQRNAKGQLNLQTAFAPGQSAAPANHSDGQKKDQTPRAPSWHIVLPELNLQDYAVDFEDLQPSTPVRTRLHRIALAARNLSTEPQKKGNVDLKLHWADQGTLSAGGEMSLSPLQAALDMTVDKLDIRPLQSYMQEFVKLVFTKGEFSTRGRMQWASKEKAMDLQFTGQASLDDFEAVDAEKAALFSKWKSLYLTGVHIGTAPSRVQVEKVALTDFFNRLIINTDGTVNIETILVKTGKAGASTGAKEKQDSGSSGRGTAIGIKTIALQGGRVDFNDKYIRPQVHLVMEDLGGIVSGLDNIKENKADVRLLGKVGGNVPLEITGRVNPLIEKPFVDLTLNFPAFDLSPFTPYSGKYLGYTLKKGQLAFSLEYLVADNKLTGKNKIQLSQLTFGSPVASPQATKLPVKLAVALLKDRAGNIDLDLPVKGDLDDPQFSLGGVILKMFVNLITQIVSSPFKMLGSIFGGGEELAYLEFDPGQSAISPSQAEKLNTLEKILFERPGLRLDIQGQIAPEQDADALRRLRFDELLKTDKLKALVAAGRKAVPLERIALSPEERNTMIQKAFDAADLPKPRDENGRLKKIPPPEMEKLLLASIDIGADGLRRLAYDRASAAKEYLLAKGRIESGRLFIMEPRIPGDNAGKDAKPQVQFDFK